MKKSRKRLLISSVAMLLVAMLALGTATFAWFTSSTTSHADGIKVKTNKVSHLVLSNHTKSNWTTHLDYGFVGENNTPKVMYPASSINGTNWFYGNATFENRTDGRIAKDTELTAVSTQTYDSYSTQVHVESISDHTDTSDASKALFSIAKTETKVITINVWLQNLEATDITTNLSSAIIFNNLSIVSSLSPRKITLVPTGYWNSDNPWYAAYVFGSSATGESAKWINLSTGSTADYSLTDNNDGSYSFYLKGKYTKIIFARMRTGYSHSTVPAFPANSKHSDSDMWNKTEDQDIPTEETNMHPTFIVGSTGSADNGATGSWETPATVKVNYVTGYSNGTIGLTCDTNNTRTGICQVVTKAATNITSQQSPNQNYAFVGWYTNAEGTGTAVQTITTAPAAGVTVTYYAKFVRTYTVTMKSVNSSGTETTSLGTMTMTAGGVSTTSDGTVSSVSQTYPEGTTVTFTAAGNTNNGLLGIYTTQSGTTSVSQITVTEDRTVYARYTDKQTVYIGYISYRNSYSARLRLHYWGGASGTKDVTPTSMGTTISQALGSSYWNNDAQTFYMYQAEIDYSATDFEVWEDWASDGTGTDVWFGSRKVSNGNCMLAFENSGPKNIQTTYTPS